MKLSPLLLLHSCWFLIAGAVLQARETEGSRTPYVHAFSDGNGGWIANNGDPLRIWDGVANCYSPWFLDANHAPPGAGYLHLILWIHTDQRWEEGGRSSRLPYRASSFVRAGKSKDLRNAKLTVRLRGEVDLKGAQLILLAQSQTPKTTANMVLTGQPLRITEDWSEQTIVLANDEKQWTCLGARKGREQEYGCDAIDTVLSDVNCDLIFVLFPLNATPACKGADGPGLYANVDYPANAANLPRGLIQFASIRIDYPKN